MKLPCILLLLVQGICSHALAWRGGDQVTELRIQGALRMEPRAILARVRQAVGRPLLPLTIREDVRRIYRMGRFRDVWVELQKHKGGWRVTYQVREKPMIRKIHIRGAKELSKEDVQKVLNIRRYGILNRIELRKNAQKIVELYREKGFPLAEVKAHVSKPTRAAVDVTFQVEEHAKLQIRKIHFVGNQQVKAAKLRELLYSQEFNIISFFTGRSLYRKRMVSRDLQLLQKYYMDRGFAQVKVHPPMVQVSKDRKAILLTYSLSEGPRYRYGAIDITGDLLGSRASMRKRLSLRRGQYFNRTKLVRDNVMRLQRLYHDRGYAYANIIPRPRIDRKKRRMHITFHIAKGEKIYIERIEVTGNSTTRDAVIRREIALSDGDLYHGGKVELSQRRIFALGYFAKTHPLYGVKVVSKPGSRPDRMILRFVVKEKPSGNFNIGMGYGSLQGLMLTTNLSQRNFMGWGKAVSLALQLSWTQQQASLQYVDPHFLGSDFTFGASFFHTMSQTQTFSELTFGEMRTGGSLTFGVPLLRNLGLFFTYKAERIGLNPLYSQGSDSLLLSRVLLGSEGWTFTSSLRTSLQLDFRNNRLFPTSGSFHSVSLEAADSFLGSKNRFYRLDLTSRWYAELPLGMVFKVNAQLGLVTSPTDQPVSYFERYRQGGINTLRGYADLSIGPTKTVVLGDLKSSQLVWGGNKQLLLNVELEFPIIPTLGIRGVVFFDAGNVFADHEIFFQDTRNSGLPLGLFMSVGVGIRWRSPMGPLRFEFGFPLIRRATDEPFRFHFSIGRSF